MPEEHLTQEVRRLLEAFGGEAAARNSELRDQTINLSGELIRRGMHEEALELLSRLGRLFPGHAGTWKAIGVALMVAHRFAEAETCFHRALALEPHLHDVYVYLAELYKARKEDRKANECLRIFLRLHKKREELRESRVHASLGWLDCVRGNEKGAIRHFREAMKKGLDNPQTFLELRLAARHLKERAVPGASGSAFVATMEELEVSVRKQAGQRE